MRIVAVFTCILVAASGMGSAKAQALYICASSAGHSYQQAPCGAAARLIGLMTTTPEPPPSASIVALRSSKAEQDRAESEFLSRRAGTDGGRVASRSNRSARSGYGRPRRNRFQPDPQADACLTAKAVRKRVLQEVGLGRTIELMRRLDGEVWATCSH